jgi:hypothetical protein
LGVLGASSLLLAAWVTTAGYVPILRGIVPDEQTPRQGPPPGVKPPPEASPRRPREAHEHLGVDITIAMYAILILLLLGLAAIVVRRVTLRRRPSRDAEQVADPKGLEQDWELTVSQDLARSASRGLAALHEGEPRDAIVRCWTELEDAVEQTGLARDPALTSEEFTAAVLHEYAVKRADIETLGALYREARFSEHPMGEDHRARAIAALRLLRDELGPSDGPHADPAATAGPRR